jgi:DNA-binding transcriptional MerR regulator
VLFGRKWLLTTHPIKTTGRKPRLSQKQQAAVIAQKRKGAGTKALAERFGVSEVTIRRVVRDAGVARVEAKTDTAMVSVRVPRTDIRAFEATISKLGFEQKSDALRAFVRHPAGFLTPDDELVAALRGLDRAFVAIGTNVNQIARRLNDFQLHPKDRKLTQTDAALLKELRDDLKAARAQISVLKGNKARDRDAAFRAIVSGAQDGTE